MRRALVLSLVAILAAAFISPCIAAEVNQKSAAIQALKAEVPGVRIYREGENISRIFGKKLIYGVSPISTAEEFKQRFSAVFGVSPQDLKPGSELVGGVQALPLMYDRATGNYKFTLVYYSQYSGGIPVFRADLGLLVRNEPGYPVVMAASALRDLGEFSPPAGLSPDAELARSAARSFLADLCNFSEPRLVVWAGIDDQVVRPAAVMEIVADNGKYASPDYEKWLFLVDAESGRILYTEDMILDVDVTGSVNGMATEGWGADQCSTEVATPMPYVRVEIQGGEWTYADENGDFVISNDGDTQVTVVSEIRGQWFRVYNQGGSNAHLTQDVVPPGPADFIHNEQNLSELPRAEVNGYINANMVRDFVLTYYPRYPVIYSQEQFPVNVNINDYCNAYYDYSSINFFRSGGGCSNTAFSTVIYHEYGHHLVASGGSGQGQYGEGLGDVMGVLISELSGLAFGFQGNCQVPLRDADNNYQYPCAGEIHDCGQLLSGCVWDIRSELMVNYPDDYMDILSGLLVNSIPLHRGDQITPSIAIDFLTLDDNDGDIYNGTPHYDELCAGFGVHNMDCPEVILIQFVYPDGLPPAVEPSGGTTVNVEVMGNIEEPRPNTGMIHINDGSGWADYDMDMGDPNVYEAIFPESECGTQILYYFSAETNMGNTVTDPRDAPASTFSAYSATGLLTIFEDNFEQDLGWTVVNSPGLVDGQWDRGVPVNCDRGDPPSDYDGSGMCYLTDNSNYPDCNSDVDDGYTYLISPAFDLTDKIAVVNYALWYSNYYGADPYNDIFNVWISDDGGDNWTLAQSFGPLSSPGWTEQTFVVNDLITPTDNVMVRFEASDLNAGSVVEAGVDAFSIVEIQCEPTDITDEDGENGLPTEFALLGSYPNPFNASMTIKYALPERSFVTIEIFDLLGRSVETLLDKEMPAGYQQVTWNAGENSTGVYFYRIKAGDFTDTGKAILLK